MNDNIANPFAKPLYVMLKPAGAHCNLACKYCYYLEKNKLYPTAQRHLMSDEMLEQFTREYIEAQTMNQVLFTWFMVASLCCAPSTSTARLYPYSKSMLEAGASTT